ncbi:MAG TPA: kinase, partial [Bacillota bacterium]|nr:kinase [Bacillota bacterium]
VEEFVKIEPTDSIVFRDMVLFDYKGGKHYENIGGYLKFYILAFEGSRVVDTLEFNKRDLPPLSDISDILKLVKDGIESADISKIAQASAISIRRNLNRLPYDIYNAVEKLSHATGGLGLIGGHSGNVLGIIYDDRERCMYTAKNIDAIAGCKRYLLETLLGNEYERDYDYRPG